MKRTPWHGTYLPDKAQPQNRLKKRRQAKERAAKELPPLVKAMCKVHELPVPVLEYPFAKDIWLDGDPHCDHQKKRFRCVKCGARLRQWRFDYLFEDWLAVEQCGGVWTRGHHSRGQDQLDDWEKWNEAAILGYSLLFFSPQQLENGSAFAVIKRCLHSKEERI